MVPVISQSSVSARSPKWWFLVSFLPKRWFLVSFFPLTRYASVNLVVKMEPRGKLCCK